MSRRLLFRLAFAAAFAAVVTSVFTGSLSAATGTRFSGPSRIALPSPATVSAPILNGLSLAASSVVGGSSASGTVNLSGPAPVGGVSVSLSSSALAATVPPSVLVPSGATSAAFAITTAPVAAPIPALIRAMLGANSHGATLTVMPPAAPSPAVSSLLLNPTSVVGGSPSQATVTLAAAAPAGGVAIALNSSSSAATVPASVNVPVGAQSASFTVSTSAVSSLASATISASFAGSTRSAPLSINPPALAMPILRGLALSPTAVAAGSQSRGTVTLSSAAPAGGVTVALSSSSSVAAVPGSVSVPAGATSASFGVTTAPVAVSSSALIRASLGGNSHGAMLTVNPAPVTVAAVSALSLNPTSVIGGGSSQAGVTLSTPAPAGGVSVALSSSSLAARVPASVTVPAGGASATFTVSTTSVSSPVSASITAALAGQSKTATLNINTAPPPASAPILSGLALSPATVVGGNIAQGTVTLSGPAPTGGLSVALASGALNAASVPPSIAVPAGSATAVFTITTVPVAVATSALIRATLGPNTHGATLNVLPPLSPSSSPRLTSLMLNPASLTGGSPSQGTVKLSGAAPAGGVVVALSSNSSSATVPANVTVPAGLSSVTFTVTTSTVGSTVNAAIGAGFGGSTQSATLVISAVTPPPPPSGAQLFVSTSGSDSNQCTQASPCASFSRAYQLARPGDTVEVAAGTYGVQTVLQTQPPKAAPAVTFRSASGAQVIVAGIQLGQNNGSASGTSPSNLTFDGFNINGQFHASYSGVGVGASNITLKNSHAYQWNAPGPLLELRDVINFTADNVELGPACCQADGIELAIRSDGNPNPQNVVFDHLYVHDIADTCSMEPRYPACAGSGYGDGCTTCDHIDGIQAFGGDGITIRNSRFYNAGTQNIFLQSANGGTFSNVTIENTMVSTSVGSPTNSVSLGGPGVSVFRGFARFRNNTFQKDFRIYQRVLAPGTQVDFTDNIAYFRGDEGYTQPCNYTAGDGSTITPTYSHNLFSDKTCGATDQAGSPTYMNSNSATPDLRLASGSRGIDAADPSNYTPSDIDGVSRPKGAGPDIGAGER